MFLQFSPFNRFLFYAEDLGSSNLKLHPSSNRMMLERGNSLPFSSLTFNFSPIEIMSKEESMNILTNTSLSILSSITDPRLGWTLWGLVSWLAWVSCEWIARAVSISGRPPLLDRPKEKQIICLIASYIPWMFFLLPHYHLSNKMWWTFQNSCYFLRENAKLK